jgi:hypothetical protein
MLISGRPLVSSINGLSWTRSSGFVMFGGVATIKAQSGTARWRSAEFAMTSPSRLGQIRTSFTLDLGSQGAAQLAPTAAPGADAVLHVNDVAADESSASIGRQPHNNRHGVSIGQRLSVSQMTSVHAAPARQPCCHTLLSGCAVRAELGVTST